MRSRERCHVQHAVALTSALSAEELGSGCARVASGPLRYVSMLRLHRNRSLGTRSETVDVDRALSYCKIHFFSYTRDVFMFIDELQL